ncbi:MAG TPA: hypothetical protein VKP30_30580 [Polyangiaceae bacterium]|nr:hypothetical protein [Polyangiaceae bacterium]
MYLNKSERDFVKTTELAELFENLTSCGLYVNEVDDVTAESRVREVSLAIMKVCALALSHGIGRNGTVCDTLDSANPIELELDTQEIGKALCGAIVLLEQGTELAKLTREMVMDDEKDGEEPESDDAASNETEGAS